MTSSNNTIATDYVVYYNRLQGSANIVATNSAVYYNSSTFAQKTDFDNVYNNDGVELDMETPQKSYQDMYG